MQSKTKVGLMAFLGLIGIQASLLQDRQKAEIQALFQGLVDSGSLHVNEQDGSLTLNDGAVEDLIKMDTILFAGPNNSEITTGGCF